MADDEKPPALESRLSMEVPGLAPAVPTAKPSLMDELAAMGSKAAGVTADIKETEANNAKKIARVRRKSKDLEEELKAQNA